MDFVSPRTCNTSIMCLFPVYILLEAHRYITLEPETERQMEFYSHARVDGLAKRVEIPSEMTETFEARPDGLYHRHVIFGKRLKMPMAANAQDPNSRPVLVNQQ
ncbi:DRC7 protein, partial [Atractosteus spatula]|nr:DRC7 protein [Atractosteus spatula]